MQLVLVRHGETSSNAAGIAQGWLDSPLNDLGEAQARQTAQALAARRDLHPIAVYASPLQRAWRTGELLAQALGLPLTAEADLREINVGAATGLPFATIADRWPTIRADRETLGLAAGWHEGETGWQFRNRIAAGIDRILAAQWSTQPGPAAPDEAVLIAAHGGTIGFALAYLLDLSTDHWPPHTVGNCSITQVQLDRSGHHLLAFDQRDHLTGSA